MKFKSDIEAAQKLIEYKTRLGKHVPEYAKKIVANGVASPSESSRLHNELQKFIATNSSKIKKISGNHQ